MAYSSGSLIEATDYNSRVNSINSVWFNDVAEYGYGQTALTTVAAENTVTAAQWASMVNTIAAMANHQGTTITARTAPVTGDIIEILAAVDIDITKTTTNRLNAVASGSQFTGWTGTSAKTTATSGATWTITFTHTIDFGSPNQARYFFNAGGRIKIDFSKTSTGDQGDAEWNDLASTLCGDIFITAGGTQTIAGTSYTGTTKIGGTGTPDTLASSTGWYGLTTSDTRLYRQYADTAPYTSNNIEVNAKTQASASQLVLTTTWNAFDGDAITGGTAPSGATPGTAPTTLVTLFPPSTTYLTNSWGTPSVTAGTV